VRKETVVTIGDRYNRWEIISEVFYQKGSKHVIAKCDCGAIKTKRLSSLTSPSKPDISCGCLRNEAMEKLRAFPPVGTKFSRLTVVGEGYRRDKRSYIEVHCSCGSEQFDVRIDQLKDGNTTSCGCAQKEVASSVNKTHGMTETSAYSSWQKLRYRCDNPKDPRWDRYGGRGITYPETWKTFIGFWEDMAEGWYEGADIDRIDFDGNYCKENCRWVNRDVGNHNKSKSTGTSIYKGVYYDKARDAWVGRLSRNLVIYLQKRFNTEYEAAKAYDDASEQVYGDRPNGTT
jgi:hypothetical protein